LKNTEVVFDARLRALVLVEEAALEPAFGVAAFFGAGLPFWAVLGFAFLWLLACRLYCVDFAGAEAVPRLL
jgi:hypothetical protein